jgi:PAS domain S-box-containing protein
MADTEMRCNFFNERCMEFTGRPIGELLGEGWLECLHPDDQPRIVEDYAKAYASREQLVLDYRLRRADGQYRWMYVVGIPRFSEEGEFLGYIGSAIDIDERKEAEGSLQRALTEISELKNELHAENIYLKEMIKLEHEFDEIIGNSDALRYVLFKIQQVAPTDATVLISGETGTGKELVAKAIHKLSTRNHKPLVKVNCAALSAGLIESELFGHEKGAFTGAAARKIGRFELADGATLFLDEIGELPLELQSKLLRVLQEGEFERLGSSKTISADVRVVAATNRNLEAEVRAGRFREDLLFRLNVFPVTVPPLRERKEDISALVEYFAGVFGRKVGKSISSISSSSMKHLEQYHWPGNVRELANLVERSVINANDEKLRIQSPQKAETTQTMRTDAISQSLESIERSHITKTLLDTGWRIEGPRGAARILGLNPSTLRTRINKLGIVKNDSQSV